MLKIWILGPQPTMTQPSGPGPVHSRSRPRGSGSGLAKIPRPLDSLIAPLMVLYPVTLPLLLVVPYSTCSIVPLMVPYCTSAMCTPVLLCPSLPLPLVVQQMALYCTTDMCSCAPPSAVSCAIQHSLYCTTDGALSRAPRVFPPHSHAPPSAATWCPILGPACAHYVFSVLNIVNIL